MTKEQILLSGLEYYTVDPDNRRCIDEFGTCKYSPYSLGKQKTSEGCWVGRLLDKDVAKKIDDDWKMGIDIGSLIKDGEYKLPIWMEEDYMSILQYLHDQNSFWNSTGLSSLGKKEVTRICKEFNIEITEENGIGKYLN